MSADLEVFAIRGIGEIVPGSDLGAVIATAIADQLAGLEDGDVVVVTHKIVSKAEGRLARPPDGAVASIVESEAVDIVRRRGDLLIARTRHGFICANAGVDRSNVPGDDVVLLPIDPDGSAAGLRHALVRRFGMELAVVVTDTFGRAWRRGLVDVAIGSAGVEVLDDHRGRADHTGRPLQVTEVAIVDEIAAAADLVMGKAEFVPVAVVRGLTRFVQPGHQASGRAADLVRPPSEDLFL